MGKPAPWLIVEAAVCGAQRASHHISGRVVDACGKPIEKAPITHSNHTTVETGSDGKFELDTPHLAVVIRKAGFQSERLLTQNASNVRIVMRPADKKTFPGCAEGNDYVGLKTDGFWFPRLPGIIYSRPGNDIDYVTRSYYVETASGAKGIRHGSGPLWSVGLPLDRDILESVEYQEVVYPLKGETEPFLVIVDARGRLPDGTRWRSLGEFGESADYHGVEDATAQILDRVIDGACLK